MLIKGMDIILWQKSQTGVDSLNEPVYEWSSEKVHNVLVGEPFTVEPVDDTSLTARSIGYTLGIPKGDTHDWENQIVEFFGHKFMTYGMVEQGIEANVPGPWHKKVKCQRYE